MKKLILFLLLLIPWFLSGLFVSFNPDFYQSLSLPFFTPPTWLFGIVWTILYVLIALSVLKIVTEYPISELKNYIKPLVVNYLANQLFMPIFFQLNNLFLAFIDTVVVVISLLFVYYEAKSLNEKSAKLLLPYLIWSIFAMILSLTIYFMNL